MCPCRTTPLITPSATLVSNPVTSRSAPVAKLCTTALAHARYAPKLPTSFMEIMYFSAFVKVLVFVNSQKSEWKLHRLECEALSKLPKERRRAVTPSLRLMIRLYCRSKLQSQKVNNQFLNTGFLCFWYTTDDIFVLLFVDCF